MRADKERGAQRERSDPRSQQIKSDCSRSAESGLPRHPVAPSNTRGKCVPDLIDLALDGAEIARPVGEILREVGVLVLVFAPLDALFSRGRLTTAGIVAIFAIVLPCFVMGTALGVER